jgi:tetratricopeptide (TPR) repeat protein
MKIIIHIIAIAVLAFGWKSHIEKKISTAVTRDLAVKINNHDISSDMLPKFLEDSQNSGEKNAIRKLQEILKDRETTVDETIAAASRLATDIDNGSTFMGILLTFLSAGYTGIIFVTYLLPVLVHKGTHTIYDSGEMVEKNSMSDARSKLAQGDYEGAILAFREAAQQEPDNRLPWVEIIKLQRETLHVPAAAIETIREVLENHVWKENDAAYFLFRLAELYKGDMKDRDSAAAIMQQVIDQFPETRHSANARHKLHEWGVA